MDYELTDAEREQLRRFTVLQRVIRLVLRKWAWAITACFLVLTASFSVYMVQRTGGSGHRSTATTRLLFNPRQAGRIESMGDRQLFSILDRASLKRKVVRMTPASAWINGSPTIDLELHQERRPSNVFTITAWALTRDGAVAKANAYAEALIEEYVNYRARDLKAWSASVKDRKAKLQHQVAALEAEESELVGKTGVATPVETLTMVNSLLSDQRRNLFELGLQIANEEARVARLESTVGTNGPLVSAHAGEIRKRSESIAKVDAEIATLLETYTEINPKVTGKLQERERLLANYSEFLESKGITGISGDEIEKLARTAEALDEATIHAAVLRDSQAEIEREIAESEKRSEVLTAAIPALKRLQVRRDDLDRTMRNLDDQLENLAYLESSAASDLRQIEPAAEASSKNPWRPFNFIVALCGAAFGTGVLIVWILAVELAFGKVRDGKEIAALETVRYIGSLPDAGTMPEEEEKEVLDVVSLKAANSDVQSGVILVCRLPGTGQPEKFREALDWTFAMSGRSVCWIDIEAGASATGESDGTAFQVTSNYVLSPAELEMLKAEIASKRAENDIVMLAMPDEFRQGGSFLDQLLSASDAVLLLAGAEKTPRSWFAYACNRIQISGKPASAVATGVPPSAVRREMEAIR